MLAPVVVFAYNRVDHLKRTLDALSDNFLSDESNLIIFCDGPKNDSDLNKVNQVRDYLKEFRKSCSFKSIETIESEKNQGLATSIISGVTTIINRYNKIIVIEDDVLTSKYFLLYMNDALKKYENNNLIGSVASFVPDIKIPNNYPHSVFVTMRPTSIAWGTWKDRWETIVWEMKSYHFEKFNLLLRKNLNSWGNDVAGRLDRFKAGYNNSWAVRFTVSGIKSGQFAVHPVKSLSEHIGFDNSGTNTTVNDSKRFKVKELSNETIQVPDIPPVWNVHIRNEYRKKHHRSNLSNLGEYILVAILGIRKNSFILRKARKLSGFIKSGY